MLSPLVALARCNPILRAIFAALLMMPLLIPMANPNYF
jgi:hypothetical protein